MKYRSLLFNLKDGSNPELRARVLMGDIPPAKLVRMSTENLASRVRPHLARWRGQQGGKDSVGTGCLLLTL